MLEHATVSITCGMDDIGILGIEDESGMLVWPASAKVDVMASITSTSVVLGLSMICTASLVDRVAVRVNPVVSSVSLTNESKLSCGQCLMKFGENCNSVAEAFLLSV